MVFHANVKRELLSRKRAGDIVLVYDVDTKDTTEAVNVDKDLIIVEPSVTSAEAYTHFRCYESYPLKAAFAGTEGVSRDEPRWYWRVVPACFDVGEYSKQHKEDYGMYIAEAAEPWGLMQAIEACDKAGAKLKICGEVDIQKLNLTEWPAHVEYLGKLERQSRLNLLGRARFGFLMSLRWEPFGADVIEMMLSGCVPITSDLGAMTEYIVDGMNGFRCNSFRDVVRAIKTARKLNTDNMITFAKKNFSLEAVRPKYERAFEDFENVLEGKGWLEESESSSFCSLGLDYRPLYL
jgi:glycosyltransferase involved in cell wall biosynthesis